MSHRDPTPLRPAHQTRREALVEALTDTWRTPRELAREQRIRIGELAEELEHVRRSLGRRLEIRPAECAGCSFVFRGRERTTTPSRCPQCKRERIDGPWFRVAPSDQAT